MKTNPLVSIICLCYNQAKFVEETLESVWNQTYQNIQLIVVDDCSTDGSNKKIASLLKDRNTTYLALTQNVGSTQAFNKGLELAQGKYVIDLAADDVLDKKRVARQVAYFESSNEQVGVLYSDAVYISQDSQKLTRHFSNKRLYPHEGDIYMELLDRYFIPTPTMIIRKNVFEELKGYDENLSYEDFDFWIRSSRNWLYAYQNEVLTYIRKSKNSFSTRAYAAKSRQVYDTYLVCEKIKDLNKSKAENEAIKRRLKYEIRLACLTGFHAEAKLFYALLKDDKGINFASRCWILINRMELNFAPIRNLYHRIRYGSSIK